MTSIKYIRDRARQILSDFEIQEPPIPVYEIVEGFALRVEKVQGSEGYDGELIPEQRLIRINTKKPKNRQRFTIAHELGHWVLYHKERLLSFDDDDTQPSSSIIIDTGYDEEDPFDNDDWLLDPNSEDFVPEPVNIDTSRLERDWEANVFAAELLMPTKWVRRHWKEKGSNVEALAKLYEVSQEAMWYRIKNLGLLK